VLKELCRLKTTDIDEAAINGALALVKWQQHRMHDRRDGLEILKFLHTNRSEDREARVVLKLVMLRCFGASVLRCLLLMILKLLMIVMILMLRCS